MTPNNDITVERELAAIFTDAATCTDDGNVHLNFGSDARAEEVFALLAEIPSANQPIGDGAQVGTVCVHGENFFAMVLE